MKTTIKFALFSALLSVASIPAFADDLAKTQEADCVALTESVKSEVVANVSQLLQIVEKFVRANPTCACEVVKSAIVASEADAKTVASIVEVAALASPEQMRLVAQCAVAVAPDALGDVQAVLAKLDPGTGDSGVSGKEVAEKGGMTKGGGPERPANANPLDFPTNGGPNQVGPTPGGPGGYPLLPPFFPYQPPYINPPVATND